MTQRKAAAQDFIVDKLTNSIENVVTGDSFQTGVTHMRNISFIISIFFIFLFSSFSQAHNQTDSTLNDKIDTTQVIKKDISNKKVGWLFRSTDNLATIIGYILVSIASLLTFFQWKKEQQWKRKEALMNRVISFSITPGAWNAMLMLESPDRDIPLWDKEMPEQRYERVKRLEVAVALLPHSFLASVYSPKETAIRDSFNDFLGRLSHLEVYRESGLLDKDEVEVAISNWIVTVKNLISSPQPTDQALLRSLFLYIDYRNMAKVIAIFHEFDIQFRSKIEGYKTIIKKEIEQNKWQRLS